jgi:hypothetical protein
MKHFPITHPLDLSKSSSTFQPLYQAIIWEHWLLLVGLI